jgi:hypothetical protein
MIDLMSPRPRTSLLLALGVVVLTSACSVSFGNDSTPSASPSGASVAPLVQDEKATIDLRSKPTREGLGFKPGSTAAFYDRSIGSDGIRVQLLLPGGKSTEVLAFSISSVSIGNPLHPPADPKTAPPSETVLNARYASPEAAKTALEQQADALGLNREQLTQRTEGTQPGVIAGTVIDGTSQDWLNIQAEIRTSEDAGQVVVNYLLSYDSGSVPARS